MSNDIIIYVVLYFIIILQYAMPWWDLELVLLILL